MSIKCCKTEWEQFIPFIMIFSILLLPVIFHTSSSIAGNCQTYYALLNQANPPASEIMVAFNTSYYEAGGNPNYPFKWPGPTWNLWKTTVLAQWPNFIGNPGITNNNKAYKIFNTTITFMDTYVASNKSYVLCVPMDNWGYFGDFLTCKFKLM